MKHLLLICKRWLFRAFIIALALIMFAAIYQRLRGSPVPMILGGGAAVVQTGSMEPCIPTGSLIFIQDTDSYEVGDIITYLNKQNIAITHRIVEMDGKTITTQGDTNNAKDRPINAEQIIGKVQLIVPGMGRSIVPVLFSVTVLLAAVITGDFTIKRKEQAKNE